MTTDNQRATIQDLLGAKEIILVENGRENKVKLAQNRYGGARVDRLRGRNQITTGLGLPRPEPGHYWSLDAVNDAYGTFLADVFKDIVRGNCQVIVDGRPLKIEDNGFTHDGSYMDWP